MTSKGLSRMFLSVPLIIFLLLPPVPLFADGQNARNLFLWQVQSSSTTVYLLGSIHVLKKEFYPIDSRIEEAFDSSDVLAVEANITDVSNIDMAKLLDAAFYEEGDTLRNHVSSGTYALATKEFGVLGIPPPVIDRQRPWMLAVTLPALQLSELGFDPNYGLDMYFLKKSSGKKRIVELESIDSQLALFSAFTAAQQEALLRYSLRDPKVLEKEVGEILCAWQKGDTEAMGSILTRNLPERKDMSAVYEKIVNDRNRSMSGKIEELLKSREVVFVVVGAGHLVGKGSIIEILRDRGYRIEQLTARSLSSLGSECAGSRNTSYAQISGCFFPVCGGLNCSVRASVL
jgi:uncharacterized protein